MTLTGLSLFSGNGGIDLALKDYVYTIGYCENDKYSQHLLATQMARGSLPVAPIYPDVRKLRGKPGDCDIIFGGFPCQDISVAGNGKGLEGQRSGLFFEIIRLTKEILPTFVFLENVPAIRTRGLSRVIKEFSAMGYDCRWTIVSAKEVGAPHVRKRWFMLAYASSERLEGQRNRAKLHETKESVPASDDASMANTECYKSRLQSGGSSRKGGQEKTNYMDGSWWFSEPSVDRVVDGTSFRVDRVKSLGNGVVPLQVKTAFERLMGL